MAPNPPNEVALRSEQVHTSTHTPLVLSFQCHTEKKTNSLRPPESFADTPQSNQHGRLCKNRTPSAVSVR